MNRGQEGWQTRDAQDLACDHVVSDGTGVQRDSGHVGLHAVYMTANSFNVYRRSRV
jgi:hypothetical protein